MLRALSTLLLLLPASANPHCPDGECPADNILLSLKIQAGKFSQTQEHEVQAGAKKAGAAELLEGEEGEAGKPKKKKKKKEKKNNQPQASAGDFYPNVTIGGKDLQATIFLPGVDNAFYTANRFDHGTMVGDIKLGEHLLFPNDFWSQPHDPARPDAGVGIASEFGCGEGGTTCGSDLGWGAYSGTATNGVLGFEEAEVGEPFLKIGVGKLVKNSEDYSPFEVQEHSEAPIWTVDHTRSTLTMAHAAQLNSKWGYRLKRRFEVKRNRLIYTTTLENTGSEDFTTTHYSHSFLSMDHQEVGPGWEVSLDTSLDDYSEPGVGIWAVPLTDHWALDSSSNSVRATNAMGSDKHKAVFRSSTHDAKGIYTATFNNSLSVRDEMTGPLPLFAFNLYIESTTLSPEPMQWISVPSGQKVRFGHKLTFSDAP